MSLDDEDERDERPRRRRRAQPAASQGPLVLVALLVLLFFSVLAVGAFFLVRHLAAPEKPEVVEAEAPAPQPEPPKPESAKPAAPEPKPPVEPVRPPEPVIVTLDGPVYAMYTGGAGRYLVFQLNAPRQLVVYDVPARKVSGTITTLAPGTSQIAVGREKLFVGRGSDARITRYDLRTGQQEAVGGPNPPERLNHLAIGSGSDGPLVVGTHPVNAGGVYQARLFDAETFESLTVPIDDPNPRPGRGMREAFPFEQPTGANHIAVSGDGRAICLSDRLYTRTARGYKAVPINPSSGLRPSPDGTVLLGNSLVGEDGRVMRFEDRQARWLIPAADGPFFLSVEYGQGQDVRVLLHADQEQKPLGELPGTDELNDWMRTRGGSAVSLSRHLAFLPEPGLLVFAPTGSREVKLIPVDLPGMLAKVGRDVSFTSVPPVAMPKDRPYTYKATAITADAARPTFALESGPPGMTVTPDGRLTWSPDAQFGEPTADVRLVARSPDGKQAVQQFRLFLPSK